MLGLSFSHGTSTLASKFSQNEQFLWFISIFCGILMCKIVYEVTGRISLLYFKGYTKLSKAELIEWNNRGFSTFHALVAALVTFYLVMLSDIFQDGSSAELMINRKSIVSDHNGVFDWLFSFGPGNDPSVFSSFRWYLDVAGQKSSSLYVYNGIALFLGWLVARILLFIYCFIHMYRHFDQVRMVFPLGFYSLLVVPPMMALMNLIWFWKIFKGMKKSLSKGRHMH